jgi:carboxyl-terminal processing protease
MESRIIIRIVPRIVAVLACLSGVLFGQTSSIAKLTLEERVFVASQINALLQLHSVDVKQASDPSLTGSYGQYLHEILINDDRRYFDLATMEFVAQFHSGHTLFWDSWLGQCCDQSLGFYATPLDAKWIVRRSFLDGLRPGDALAAINDQKVDDFFQNQRVYISASSEAARRNNLFRLPYLFPEEFSLTLEGGRVVAVNRASTKEHYDDVEGRWLRRGELAYVRIPDFFSPLAEQKAIAYVQQFQKAGALIVDVRRNPGGISPTSLVAALMDRPYRRWKESTPIRIGWFDYGQETVPNSESNRMSEYMRGYIDALASLGQPQLVRNPLLVSPDATGYKGKIIFLVDGGCVSACEDLIQPFKDNGRAMLIGELTEGSSGLPFFYDFHNGMSVKIAIKRYYMPDGSEFEGVGIKPDIEVSPTIEDLKHGRDVALQKALKLLGITLTEKTLRSN